MGDPEYFWEDDRATGSERPSTIRGDTTVPRTQRNRNFNYESLTDNGLYEEDEPGITPPITSTQDQRKKEKARGEERIQEEGVQEQEQSMRRVRISEQASRHGKSREDRRISDEDEAEARSTELRRRAAINDDEDEPRRKRSSDERWSRKEADRLEESDNVDERQKAERSSRHRRRVLDQRQRVLAFATPEDDQTEYKFHCVIDDAMVLYQILRNIHIDTYALFIPGPDGIRIKCQHKSKALQAVGTINRDLCSTYSFSSVRSHFKVNVKDLLDIMCVFSAGNIADHAPSEFAKQARAERENMYYRQIQRTHVQGGDDNNPMDFLDNPTRTPIPVELRYTATGHGLHVTVRYEPNRHYVVTTKSKVEPYENSEDFMQFQVGWDNVNRAVVLKDDMEEIWNEWLTSAESIEIRFKQTGIHIDMNDGDMIVQNLIRDKGCQEFKFVPGYRKAPNYRVNLLRYTSRSFNSCSKMTIRIDPEGDVLALQFPLALSHNEQRIRSQVEWFVLPLIPLEEDER